MTAFLGIDLGTSGLRALLIDESGAPLASAEARYDVRQPRDGWSEQDPADWLAALDAAIASLRAASGRTSDIAGIGVAGHMHGAVLLDDADAVLRPCILWNDARSEDEAAELNEVPAFRRLTGNLVFPGFTAPKLVWVRRNEPDIWLRTRKVVLPAAFLNHHLTGGHVGDLSDASGASWLDVGARRWSGALLTEGGMRAEQMPRLVEGSSPAGLLRPSLAARWGVRRNVVVAGGAGDNAAAACGMGLVDEGRGFVSLGTSGVILAARSRFEPAAETAVHTFCHAIPDRWVQMSVMLSASDSLSWLGAVTGRSPEELTAEVGEALSPPGPARFLPYLSGERTPHNDARIRGGFTGLSIAHGRIDMTRAVLEGVSFALKDGLDALAAAGTRPSALYAIGGGAASPYWLRLLATALDTPLLRPRGGEFGAAMGAARLAICAATGAAPRRVMTAPDDVETIDPDEALVPAFAEAHAAFQDAFSAVLKIQ